jgi:hypothetical protein
MVKREPVKSPVVLWKLVLLATPLFLVINFAFEAAVAASGHDIRSYYSLTRVVVLLIVVAVVKSYRERKAK